MEGKYSSLVNKVEERVTSLKAEIDEINNEL
jgi:hypothetical protein